MPVVPVMVLAVVVPVMVLAAVVPVMVLAVVVPATPEGFCCGIMLELLKYDVIDSW